MVIKYRNVLISAVLLSSSAYADNYQQFQNDVDKSQSTIDHSKQLLRYDQLDQFIEPIDKSGEGKRAGPGPHTQGSGLNTQKTNKTTANKSHDGVTTVTGHAATKPASGSVAQGKDKPESPNKAAIGKVNSHKTQKSQKELAKVHAHRGQAHKAGAEAHSHKDIYIAPSMRASSGGDNTMISNSPDVQQPEKRSVTFGIRIGSEIPVVLVGGASNVQNAYMKFRVTKTVHGDVLSLPVNTLLFSTPSAVIGSQRLYSNQEMRGITPSGKEFTLKGSIMGNDNLPGLLAYVVNDGKTLYRATDAGKNALAQGALAMVGNGIIQDAGKAVAGQVLSEQQNESQAKYGRDVYVVQANTQSAVIEIEDTF